MVWAVLVRYCFAIAAVECELGLSYLFIFCVTNFPTRTWMNGWVYLWAHTLYILYMRVHVTIGVTHSNVANWFYIGVFDAFYEKFSILVLCWINVSYFEIGNNGKIENWLFLFLFIFSLYYTNKVHKNRNMVIVRLQFFFFSP